MQYSTNVEGERLAAFATVCLYCHDRSPVHHSTPHSDLREGGFSAGNGYRESNICQCEIILMQPKKHYCFIVSLLMILCSPQYGSQEKGYTVTHLIISCGFSTIFIIYFSLALAYKVIIHVIGLVLAFLTRKVKIDTLNDSKASAAIIYSSCLMLILATIAVFALYGVNAYASVWTTLVFAEVCVFLGLTFIPKARMKKQIHILFISVQMCTIQCT